MTDRRYSRKYLRIRPELPMLADMSIVQIGSRWVKSGAARVRIIDISPGGLRFVSSLSLPTDALVLLELCFVIANQEFRLKGCIIRKTRTEVYEYEYGFYFSQPDDNLRSCLKKLFNNMAVKLERHIVILKLG